MHSSFKEYLTEGVGFSQYPYKLENREEEISVLTPYYKSIQNKPNKPIKTLGFPFEYAYEKSVYNITGKPLSVFCVESLDPEIKQPETVRLNNARAFMKECPGSRVYIPALKKGDVYTPVSNVKMKHVISNIPHTKILKTDKMEEEGNLEDRKVNLSDVPVFQRVSASRSDIEDYSKWNNVTNTTFDIIDLDYVAGPHVENFFEVYSMWRKLNTSGVLLVTFALQHQSARTGVELRHQEEYPEHAALYTIKHFQNTQPSNSFFTLDEHKIKRFGLFKRTPRCVLESQNVLNNVIERLSKVFPSPVYANMYLGAKGNPQSTIMGRLAFIK